MKKLSIFIIVLSTATLVGFTFDYVVHAAKLKNYQRSAEMLKNRYYDNEPSVDYTNVKRQRDSLYFLLNQEKIMKFRKDIYNKIVSKGYSKSYENFVEKNGSEDRAFEVWSALSSNGFYDGELYEFKIQFYGILPTK